MGVGETLSSKLCASSGRAPATRPSLTLRARYGRAYGSASSVSRATASFPAAAVANKRSQVCINGALEGPPVLLFSSSSSTPAPAKLATKASTIRLPTASDLATLKMPPLHCSFPALVHPDYAVVKEPCDAWTEAVAQPPSASASSFLQDCLLPLFACRLFPKSISRRRLVHVTKALAWLMIADDDDDHPDMLGSDSAATADRADLVMAVLRSDEHADSESLFDCSFLMDIRPSFASKFSQNLKALGQLWREIREEMPRSLQARFVAAMADYFEGLKMQASFRQQGIIPNVEQYMKIRRQASFTIPLFILMEYGLGVELDEPTFYDPLIQELHNVVLDYVSLCNDVVSCRIEIQTGDYFNLPSILYNSEAFQRSSFSFQFAMDHVSYTIQSLNNRAISLISTIHKKSNQLEPAMVPFVHAYIDGLSYTMSGALAWFLETARYQHRDERNELHQVFSKERATLSYD